MDPGLAFKDEPAHHMPMTLDPSNSAWRDCIETRLQARCGPAAARAVVDTLSAFGDAQGAVPEAPEWNELCAWADDVLAGLQETLTTRLQAEVDADQAAMFSRRFVSLQAFLRSRQRTHPEAQAYLIGLAVRAAGILKNGVRTATRIRALVDYLYSYGALLDYRHVDGALTTEQLAQSATFRAVGTGLEHAKVTGMTTHGPAHVNVLIVHGRTLQCIDARGAEDLASLVMSRGAQAGVSGGFFLYPSPTSWRHRGEAIPWVVWSMTAPLSVLLSFRGARFGRIFGAYGVVS